ncbi:MAG: hypothetical protein KDB45_04520 [Mycobacterium sp.]|nr:hypothetical protein [Mycobacterium sp.]
MNEPRRAPQDPWWDYAHGCATALAQGREPPAHPMHGLLLEPGELVRTHATAHYSRLQRGPAAQHGGRAPIMAYNPMLMMGTMAAQAIADRRRNRQDAKQSQPEWRLERNASVLTTTQRIMCNRPDGGWLSFWYQDLAEHHIDLPTRTLVMAFNHDQCAPLRLQGPATPAIALWSAVQVYGDAWKTDPRLAPLLTPRTPHQQRDAAHPAITHGLSPAAYHWAQHQADAHRARTARTPTTSGRDL